LWYVKSQWYISFGQPSIVNATAIEPHLAFQNEGKGFFYNLNTIGIKDTIEDMAKRQSSGKPAPKPKTVQRTYRFDTKLFDAFEDDCARHLSNPKRVIEAMIIHWLDADPATRAALAQKHREQITYGQQDD
jgi:hypothetical protein